MIKVNHAKKLLAERDKVICSIIFRGRENAHVDEGFKLVNRLVAELAESRQSGAERPDEGRRIVVIFAPK